MGKHEKLQKLREFLVAGARFLAKAGNNFINLDGTIQSYYSDTKKSWDDVSDSYKKLTIKNENHEKNKPEE